MQVTEVSLIFPAFYQKRLQLERGPQKESRELFVSCAQIRINKILL